MVRKISLTLLFLLLLSAAIGLWLFSRSSSGVKVLSGRTGTTTLQKLFPLGEDRLLSEDELSARTGSPSAVDGPASYLNGKLKQVSLAAVSGFTTQGISTTSPLQYLEKKSGHVYQLTAAGQTERVTNTTMPGIAEVFWGKKGKDIRLIARSIKNDAAQNFSGTIKTESSATSTETARGLAGSQIDSRVYGLAVSPSGEKIFSLSTIAGVTTGIISDFDLKNPAKIFSSRLSEWTVAWPEEGTIALETKASALSPGYLYFLNAKSGKLTKVLGDMDGLTALSSPDARMILYSSSNQGSYLNILDQKNKFTGRLTFKTLPEKCVWAKKIYRLYCAVPADLGAGPLPDTWYRGEAEFDDSIWEINVETGDNYNLFDSREADLNERLDVSFPQLSADEQTLYFINKNTGILWSLDLKKGF